MLLDFFLFFSYSQGGCRILPSCTSRHFIIVVGRIWPCMGSMYEKNTLYGHLNLHLFLVALKS